MISRVKILGWKNSKHVLFYKICTINNYVSTYAFIFIYVQIFSVENNICTRSYLFIVSYLQFAFEILSIKRKLNKLYLTN